MWQGGREEVRDSGREGWSEGEIEEGREAERE